MAPKKRVCKNKCCGSFPKQYRENKDLCEKSLTTEEIEKAISNFENNKSPGNDGLTVEFYKIFSDMLLKDLQEEISWKAEECQIVCGRL